MREIILFFTFLTIGFSVVAQNTIGTIFNTDQAFDGYTLFTVGKSTYLINNCGQVINEWVGESTPGFSVYLLPDGSLLRAEYVENPNLTIPGNGGRVVIRDWDNNITWQYTFSDEQISQHHDVYPMPNGNILVLIIERKTNSEAISAGRDPANLDESELYDEKILEVKPIGTNGIEIIWEWSFWDHLIQDFDNTKDNFGDVLNNPNLLDINYLGFSQGKKNWLHVNSIQYNESLDQIVLSSRQLNEIYIIDHSTTTQEAASNTGGIRGKGGDFLYRWGNPLAYKAGSISDQKLFGQHYPHWISEGLADENKLLIFNNGFNRVPEFSSVEIINPTQTQPGDYEVPVNEKFGPENSEWIYVDQTDVLNFSSKIMSSAQRLSNGNTLICEGTEGHFFEIDENMNIVWQYIVPISPTGILSQGDPPDVSSIFRANKYNKEYEAFNGKDVSPGDPIELNFNLDNCLTLAIDNSVPDKFLIYPNPASQEIRIKTPLNIDKLELYDIQGKLILRSFKNLYLNIEEITTGVYFLKIFLDNKVVNKKIIIN